MLPPSAYWHSAALHASPCTLAFHAYGACLLTTRMNNFRFSVEEIIRVVKIADTTLRMRLKEFSETLSGALILTDFRTVWLEEMNTPAFIEGKEKERVAKGQKQTSRASEETRKRRRAASTHEKQTHGHVITSRAVGGRSPRASFSTRQFSHLQQTREKRPPSLVIILASFSSLHHHRLSSWPPVQDDCERIENRCTPLSDLRPCIQLTFEPSPSYSQPVPICALTPGLRGQRVIHRLAALRFLTYHWDTSSRCHSQALCSFRFPPIRCPDVLPPASTNLTSRLEHCWITKVREIT